MILAESQNFISYYPDSKGTPKWNSKVGLHGRYVLSVEFDIRLDQSRTHPERDGEVSFFLAEVEELLPNGYTFTDRQIRFGIREWTEIVNSEGDFEAISFPMETDKHVEGFDRTWR